MRSAAFALASAFGSILATSAAAQVLVVDDVPGPGVDFTDFQAAIDAAPEGGILLVRGGEYHPLFSLNIYSKSLTIVAESGQQPLVVGRFDIQGIVPSQRVVIRGIDVDVRGQAGTAFRVLTCSGPVLIEDCESTALGTGGGFAAGLYLYDSHLVVGSRCSFAGADGNALQGAGSRAITCYTSTLGLYDCVATGGDGFDGGSADPGGAGTVLTGGAIFASGCVLRGGDGGDSHTSVTCFDGGEGGDGIVGGNYVQGTTVIPSTGHSLDSLLLGGNGGASGGPGCSDGAPGQPSAGFGSFGVLTGTARHYAATTPVREGQSLGLTFSGLPGEAVLLDFGPTGGFLLDLGLSGVLAVASPHRVAVLGFTGPAGTLASSVTIGELGAGVEGATLFSQPAFVSLPSGAAVLGPPSAIVLLDSAF